MSKAWKEPMWLIKADSNGQLVIIEETAVKLSEFVTKLLIVGIAGYCRTGKSYLMNLLATGTGFKGFQLGASVKSCTKGIWVWCVDHPTLPEMTVLLMDTEGLGNIEQVDRSNDQWIFTLTMLLSDILVYNSKGAVDHYALEKLHFIANAAKHVMGTTENDSRHNCRRSFVWAARDFTLQLCKDGESMSSDDYLEWALSDRADGRSDIGDFIRAHFPVRKCFTFPFPTTDTQLMQHLEHANPEELNKFFLSTARDFRDFIYSHGQLCSTGREFICLLREYLHAFGEGGDLPPLRNTVAVVTELENNRAIDKSITTYNTRMSAEVQLPTDSADSFLAVHRICQKEALDIFDKFAIFDSDTYIERLKRRLAEEYENWSRRNNEASFEACKSILETLCEELYDKVTDGVYCVPGGHEAYEADLKRVVDNYRGKGIMSEPFLKRFLESKQQESMAIRKAEQGIMEKEKTKKEAQEAAKTKASLARQAQAKATRTQNKLEENRIKQTQEKLEQKRRFGKERKELIVRNGVAFADFAINLVCFIIAIVSKK